MTDAALTDAARILDGSPVPTFVIDSSHVVVYWNAALARLSGVPAAEVLGTQQQWRGFYPAPRPALADLVVDSATQDLIQSLYRDACRPATHCPGGWEAEDFFPTFGETGRWLAFSAAPIHNSEGRIVGCVETLQDISERKEAELARRESQRQLGEIVAGSPVATFVIDAQCRVTHWNRACAALTGVSATAMEGRSDIWRAFYPSETRRVVLAEMIVSGARHQDVAQYYASHARPSLLVADAFEARDFFPTFGPRGKWLHFMAAPLHDINGAVVGAIETLVDLSETTAAKNAETSA
ncbi:PAS domain-containing protein [Accumulibacter sp.]|uniref:PAS domain-containing protein n=1 Tax=Accumulibacter sp. TaxID=2053492 RepID=UPI0028C3EA40|nr:PAS domain-containing protein [Accumulibacter sp.]